MVAAFEKNGTTGYRVAVHFLYSGSSALLITLSHSYSAYWYISFLALIPFFWRVVNVSPKESLVTGCMLATAYWLVSSPLTLSDVGGAFLAKLVVYNIFFGAYAVLVNRIKKHFGLQVVFIALLWLPFEYIIGTYYTSGNIFTFTDTNYSLVIRIGSLLGALMVSFVVVVANTTLLLALRLIIKALLTHKQSYITCCIKQLCDCNSLSPAQRIYRYPNRRAPPAVT